MGRATDVDLASRAEESEDDADQFAGRSVSGRASARLKIGVVMALPVVVYDWVNGGHGAFELFMAPTAWVAGLEHFVQNGYLWWPILFGVVLSIGYSVGSSQFGTTDGR